MRSLIKDKKGDVFQIFFLLAIILAVAIVGVIMLKLTTSVNNFWDSSGLLNQTAVGEKSINTLQETAPRTTDYTIFFLFLAMNIGITIAAVKTNFSPLLIFLFIMLTLVAIMIAAGVVNMYQGLAQQPSIIGVSSQLTLTNFIFSKYLPLFISIICALTMIIMWGKSGGDIVQ